MIGYGIIVGHIDRSSSLEIKLANIKTMLNHGGQWKRGATYIAYNYKLMPHYKTIFKRMPKIILGNYININNRFVILNTISNQSILW